MTGLRGEQTVSPTAAEAALALARLLAAHLKQRLRAAAVSHLALSGGSSGALLCDVLATPDLLTPAEWSHVHVWMVDERPVPDDDSRLNFALVRERLAPRVGLPASNLHPMPVLLQDGDSSYERQLDAALSASHEGRLDAAVLGMGPDGHTASLFPHSPALDETSRAVVWNDADTVTPPRPRMTMTYPTLNRARLIALLVTGPSKRTALAALETSTDFHGMPVAGIVPAPGSRMIWFLDEAAVPGV